MCSLVFCVPNLLRLQAKRVSTRSTPVLARLVDGLIQCPTPLACSVLLVPSAEESVYHQPSDWEPFPARPQNPTNQVRISGKPRTNPSLRNCDELFAAPAKKTLPTPRFTFPQLPMARRSRCLRRVVSRNLLLQSQWRRRVRQLQDVSSVTIRACFPFL